MTFRVLVQQNKQCSIQLLGQKLVFQGILLNRVPFWISDDDSRPRFIGNELNWK